MASFRPRIGFKIPRPIYPPGTDRLAKTNFSGKKRKDLRLHKRKRGGISRPVVDISVREAPILVRLPEPLLSLPPQKTLRQQQFQVLAAEARQDAVIGSNDGVSQLAFGSLQFQDFLFHSVSRDKTIGEDVPSLAD